MQILSCALKKKTKNSSLKTELGGDGNIPFLSKAQPPQHWAQTELEVRISYNLVILERQFVRITNWSLRDPLEREHQVSRSFYAPIHSVAQVCHLSQTQHTGKRSLALLKGLPGNYKPDLDKNSWKE